MPGLNGIEATMAFAEIGLTPWSSASRRRPTRPRTLAFSRPEA
jgi:hypothetical protein